MTSSKDDSKSVVTREESVKLSNLCELNLQRVLDSDPDRKSLFLECRLKNDCDKLPAVLTLQKTPFDLSNASEILDCDVEHVMQNTVYGKYVGHMKERTKVTLIYPATSKHIDKFLASPRHIVNETPQLYESVTRPFVERESFDLNWVYNILEYKREKESIIYDDIDPDTGFILLPDLKWDGKQVEDLYVLGMVRSRCIPSLRHLRASHLPLLRKLYTDGSKAIAEKFGVSGSQIRAYLHYQPSYYHLHVHYTHVAFRAPGLDAGKAHLLPSIISALESDGDYFARATLPFVMRESDKLFSHYLNMGYDNKNSLEGNKDVYDLDKLLTFFQMMGKAKHEPCGEHWNISFGASAWRMAILTLLLPTEQNRARLLRVALTSAFTSLGKQTDHLSQWSDKLEEVRLILFNHLPFNKAAYLFDLYVTHVNARRGKHWITTKDEFVYRQILELEEAILLLQELEKEGEPLNTTQVLAKMCDLGLPGSHQKAAFKDDHALQLVLKFVFQISVLCSLKRTGWVRKRVYDPETVADHMFRMAIMAIILDEDSCHGRRDVASSVLIALCHDLGECIIGDITPHCPITPKEKQEREQQAMTDLLRGLPCGHSAPKEIYDAFINYEEQRNNEGKLVKDLDKFDMILQAYEYEKSSRFKRKEGQDEIVQQGQEGQGEKENKMVLQEFFDSTTKVFRTDKVKQWVVKLHELRSQLK